MKIALVLSQPPGYSETFLRSKIRGLQKNGMDVTLYCRSTKNGFDLCPVVLQPKVSKNPILQLLYFIKTFIGLLPHHSVVRRYLALEKKEGVRGFSLVKNVYLNSHFLKARPDWLHFGFATMAIRSETVAQAIGAKMGVSFRGFDMGTYPIKNPGCYNVLWKYVDQVHTNSNDLWASAKRFGMPDSIPVKKITPAIDVALFRTELPDFEQQTPVVFMTTGRLHWKKGYVEMIEALALLKAEGLQFEYKIIGDGPDYERIAFAAYDLGLQKEVCFLGKVPHKEVRKHLKTATIYLQYSIQEGFCNAVLEAQATGKLCVVSNAEGLAENVLHGYSGWVVPKYAPKLLAAQIKEVLALSPAEKRRFAQNAINRVRDEFTIVQQEAKFVEFFGAER
ncbi:glycosyltransferase family 4 protein [Aequorivita marina]|uniref:glycosyltransferase family 4 protein n=1 Tax=Aequorivita marina TaxID=3073654 RepID=UPI0028750D45|nr:glycosyltransferase family 4 protein [Aequorivita sp. S2608]MDS1298041.1 glycosyltransferase family 4 protein [Aequorivita sp. S2608]